MSEVYDIYHDESQEESYWHGFLFVPRKSRQYLLNLLLESRKNINWEEPISFKQIGNRQGKKSPKTCLVSSWLTIGLAALQQQKFEKLRVPFSLGGSPPIYKSHIEFPIRCKFVVFKECDKHRKMFYNLSTLACIETTFRMGIKGGMHRLFSDKDPIIVGNVFIDGDEHYIRKFGRSFDVNRSLKRLAEEKRGYVSFLENTQLIPQRSNHKKIESGQDFDDSQLLQLCDILLGGVRLHSYCPDNKKLKHYISLPCCELLKRNTNKHFITKHSRFSNGFSLSEAWLNKDEEWGFSPLKIEEDMSMSKLKQLKLKL